MVSLLSEPKFMFMVIFLNTSGVYHDCLHENRPFAWECLWNVIMLFLFYINIDAKLVPAIDGAHIFSLCMLYLYACVCDQEWK